jgi:hypothetical protein
MSQLAVQGGKKVRTKPFPPYNYIQNEEIDAVVRVMKTGKLSGFAARWSDAFFGGARGEEA